MSGRNLSAGYAYAEVLLAALLLLVALVPALDALRGGLLAAEVHETRVVQHFALSSRMEQLLAEAFNALDAEAQAVASPTAATSYSDPAGQPDRRLVYLSRFDGDDADGDGDPFTGIDDGLLWLRVQVEGTPHAFEALRAR